MTAGMRLSIIMVLVLATTMLGLLAYNASRPVEVAQVAPNAPAPAMTGYFVAAHPLPAGTLARDEDFEVRSAATAALPVGAIVETPDARAALRGSLVREFLDAGHPITAHDVLRPRDRGFLASVLAPDTRAISINVDAESGVSGLIWPGDHVDVVFTQVGDKADSTRRSVSELFLRNIRIIAIDQEIVQGASANNTVAGKVTHSVSLQLKPDQVRKITLAKDLGKLSLAIRAAVEKHDTADGRATFGCDISPEIARQSEAASITARASAKVEVFEGAKLKEYTVHKLDGDLSPIGLGCEGSAEDLHDNSDTQVIVDADKPKP